VRLAVLHGPNLNLLGVREPEIYGTETLADLDARLVSIGSELGLEVECFQDNHEGGLIDRVHTLRGHAAAAIVNAGAYSHSSLALRDALTAAALPFVEVHISNIFAREPERRSSVLAPAAIGMVTGLGTYGYEVALRALATRYAPRG
jgi:3-dehydroquinate dehydratase II